jgi:hypothetical protein
VSGAGRAGLALAALCLLGGAPQGKLDLEGARELYAQGRWREARARIGALEGIANESDREAARFLVGRSWAREAEFYRFARAFANEVGLDYLGELAKDEANRGVPWVGLFTGLYQLAAGEDAAAERSLAGAAGNKSLPERWRETARLRRKAASQRKAAAGRAADTNHDGRSWRLASFSSATDQTRPVADPDVPAVEDGRGSTKLLRFFDPLAFESMERALWEEAVAALRPLAAQPQGEKQALGAYYAGLALYRLGRLDEAKPLLGSAASSSSVGDRARILLAALSPGGSRGPTSDLAELWKRTANDAESLLPWTEVEPSSESGAEPLKQLPARLAALAGSFTRRTDRATVGRWGLARLRAGADPSEVGAVLSRLRDNANKNKIERNDPLLLLALAVASYRDSDYAQSLETIFALSEAFPGLRGLHWNLQGTYAARQKAGGEARISQ